MTPPCKAEGDTGDSSFSLPAQTLVSFPMQTVADAHSPPQSSIAGQCGFGSTWLACEAVHPQSTQCWHCAAGKETPCELFVNVHAPCSHKRKDQHKLQSVQRGDVVKDERVVHGEREHNRQEVEPPKTLQEPNQRDLGRRPGSRGVGSDTGSFFSTGSVRRRRKVHGMPKPSQPHIARDKHPHSVVHRTDLEVMIPASSDHRIASERLGTRGALRPSLFIQETQGNRRRRPLLTTESQLACRPSTPP